MTWLPKTMFQGFIVAVTAMLLLRQCGNQPIEL